MRVLFDNKFKMPRKSTKVKTVLVPRVVGGKNVGVVGDLLKKQWPIYGE